MSTASKCLHIASLQIVAIALLANMITIRGVLMAAAVVFVVVVVVVAITGFVSRNYCWCSVFFAVSNFVDCCRGWTSDSSWLKD